MSARIVVGRQSDGTIGIRCSQPGYDAASNPVDLSRLSFASDWNTVLPIYLTGSRLNVANNSDITISFTSLGYIPMCFFLTRPVGQTGWNSMPPPYNGNTPFLVAATYIDHIRIINKTSLALDVAYAMFYAVTQ